MSYRTREEAIAGAKLAIEAEGAGAIVHEFSDEPGKAKSPHTFGGTDCWCSPDVIEHMGGQIIVHREPQ